MVSSIRANRVTRKLSMDLAHKMKEYCRKEKITEAVFLETVFNMYLFKINSESSTVTIGIPVLNRTKSFEKRTAGMFISTLPLTISMTEENTIKQVMEDITKTHIQMFRHQKYPYSLILKVVREKQEMEGNLYNVMFSFQNARLDIGGETEWYSNGYSEVPFTLHVDNRDREDTYILTVDYQVEVFRQSKEIELILERLEYIARQILENDSVLVKEISILPEVEEKRILCEFNNTAMDYPRDKCVHELFMEQAEKTPDKIAVVFEEKEITYRELDEMSNGLANTLRERGIRRGDFVGVLLERDEKVIMVQLAVLKLGAVFIWMRKQLTILFLRREVQGSLKDVF